MVKLEAKPYSLVYKEILNKIEIVDDDEYYGPIFRERLAAWAGYGMYVWFPFARRERHLHSR